MTPIICIIFFGLGMVAGIVICTLIAWGTKYESKPAPGYPGKKNFVPPGTSLFGDPNKFKS